jgi:hypothetical protein
MSGILPPMRYITRHLCFSALNVKRQAPYDKLLAAISSVKLIYLPMFLILNRRFFPEQFFPAVQFFMLPPFRFLALRDCCGDARFWFFIQPGKFFPENFETAQFVEVLAPLVASELTTTLPP